MHILITTTQVPFVHGGAEVHALSLQEAFRAAGHHAEIVAVPFKWYPPERIIDTILTCRMTDLSEANGQKIDRVIGLKFPAYLIPHPNKVLWILHQHRQAYEMWDQPLSDMIHYGRGREVRDAIRRADTRLIPEAKAVFANSLNVARRLKEYCKLDATPLYHPPQNADAFYCDSAESYFFYPSRINASKRQHLAIRALAHVKGDVRLVIGGQSEDENYFRALADDVEQLGLQGRVEFVGRVSEPRKRELYAKCLAVVYPPVDEDYGYITLEAMLSSKPVVTCTDSGGPLEFVSEGHTGRIVAPDDLESFGAALASLANNPSKAAEMGRAGRDEYLRRQITWPSVVEQLLA